MLKRRACDLRDGLSVVFPRDDDFAREFRRSIPGDRIAAVVQFCKGKTAAVRRRQRLHLSAAGADAVRILVPERRDRARLHLAAGTDTLLFALDFARRGNCHRPFAKAVRVRLVRVDGVIRVDGVVRVCWIARVDGLRGAVDVAGGRRAGDDAERAAKDKREAQRRKQKLFHTLPPLVFIMYFVSSV